MAVQSKQQPLVVRGVVPEPLYDALLELARLEGRTLSSVVRTACARAVVEAGVLGLESEPEGGSKHR